MRLGGGEHLGLTLGVLLPRSRLLAHHLETPLHRRHVGQHKVEGELVELLPRLGVRAEAARDLDEDVRLARESNALRPASGRRVLDAHLGRRGLLRLHRFGQSLQPLVGHVDHADAVGSAPRGQRVEQRGLA